MRIKVTVEKIDGCCNLPMLVGDFFYVEGSRVYIPEEKYMCMWALQAMMPVFPILQEKDNLRDDHWVKRVEHFVCPDPDGRVVYRLEAE
jgi:carbon-monoxide dehydrogenase iron sulfur subunit